MCQAYKNVLRKDLKQFSIKQNLLSQPYSSVHTFDINKSMMLKYNMLLDIQLVNMLL